MGAVVFNPSNFVPDGSGNHPTVEFGNGAGMVTFLIVDEDRELLVTQVIWFG